MILLLDGKKVIFLLLIEQDMVLFLSGLKRFCNLRMMRYDLL